MMFPLKIITELPYYFGIILKDSKESVLPIFTYVLTTVKRQNNPISVCEADIKCGIYLTAECGHSALQKILQRAPIWMSL